MPRCAVLMGWFTVILWILPPAAFGAAGSERISFTSTQWRFDRDRAEAFERHGVAPRTLAPAQHEGILFRPDGDGPFPAVVLLHDCRGVRQFQHEWARALTEWGYVALLLDRSLTVDADEACKRLDRFQAPAATATRVLDAYRAFNYLGQRPDVDPNRIAVMGWAYAATLSTVAEEGVWTLLDKRFRAAVALYPNCAYTRDGRFVSPVLVLSGGRDDWAPSDSCQKMVRFGKVGIAPIKVKIYPYARHGFDDPETAGGVTLEAAWNPNHESLRGASLAYDEAAHMDALKQVRRFLHRHLVPETFTHADIGPSIDGNGTWAVDPAAPSPDIPPIGRSALDLLLGSHPAADGDYDIPFPFPALMERVAQQLGPSSYGRSPLKQVVIPAGRSLQRSAAAPEYFRYPRVVVAVDSEPRNDGDTGGMPLKDRLFLGYQEKANVIEAISYNEEAGRFEFQIIKNYGPGLRPEVLYANRSLCVSCHQNGAPMFSEAPWDETSANSRIATRMAALQTSFYGRRLKQMSSLVEQVDAATNRAALLPVYQRLWREGCGDAGDAAARCRSAAFLAMLQHRLTEEGGHDTRSSTYRHKFLDQQKREWRRRWPRGLLIPDADLRNHDPLLTDVFGQVPSYLDPLNQRPPKEKWSIESPDSMRRFIGGLAGFLIAADIKKLDTYLYDRGIEHASASVRHRSECRIVRKVRPGAVSRITFDCGSTEMSDAPSFIMIGAIVSKSGRAKEGSIRRLVINDASYSRLNVTDGTIHRAGSKWSAQLRVKHDVSGLHVRAPDGDAVSEVHLDWTEATTDGMSPDEFPGQASLLVLDDFRIVETSIDNLAEQSHDALAPQSFRPAFATAALFKQLGLSPTQWCCGREASLPPPTLDKALNTALSESLNSIKGDHTLAHFFQYCAACHQTDNRFPPNFLSGDIDTVTANVEQCAERISYRLSMWNVNATEQQKTPMPPAHALNRFGLSTDQWRDSAALSSLRGYVRSLLPAENGSGPIPPPTTPYETLRACLPPS